MEPLQKVKFMIFKPSGKYYTEGIGYWPRDQYKFSGNDLREEICRINNDKIPGLASKGYDFFITVCFCEENLPKEIDYGFPVLIYPQP